MASLAQKAVDAIIRPPRTEYDVAGMPLYLDSGGDGIYVRHHISFRTQRGLSLVGSLYHSKDMDVMGGGPCVVYLHGNASSQLEGQFLVPNFCPHNVFVFCFDFAGSGCSDGKYISLGYFETIDTYTMINLLKTTFNMGPFVVWGRSMGASVALLLDTKDVIGKISDSAFTSISDMIADIGKSQKLPSAFIPAAMWYLKRKVLKEADFDLSQVSPLEMIQKTDYPIAFGHSEEDQFIPFEHCRKLYDACRNPMKYMMVLAGGHNSRREECWLRLGVTFALNLFGIPSENLVISEARKLQEAVFHFGSFGELIKDSKERVEDKDRDVIQEYQEEMKNKEVTGKDGSKKKKHHHRKSQKKNNYVSIGTQTDNLLSLPPLNKSYHTPLPSKSNDQFNIHMYEENAEIVSVPSLSQFTSSQSEEQKENQIDHPKQNSACLTNTGDDSSQLKSLNDEEQRKPKVQFSEIQLTKNTEDDDLSKSNEYSSQSGEPSAIEYSSNSIDHKSSSIRRKSSEQRTENSLKLFDSIDESSSAFGEQSGENSLKMFGSANGSLLISNELSGENSLKSFEPTIGAVPLCSDHSPENSLKSFGQNYECSSQNSEICKQYSSESGELSRQYTSHSSEPSNQYSYQSGELSSQYTYQSGYSSSLSDDAAHKASSQTDTNSSEIS